MSIKGMSILSLSLACAAFAATPASTTPTSSEQLAASAGQITPISVTQSIANFRALNQSSNLYMRDNGSIGRVFGKAFSHGQTSKISTTRFLNQNLSMWGVPANHLVAEGPFDDGRHTQQIGYLPEFDDYKFTGHYYKQIVDGVPSSAPNSSSSPETKQTTPSSLPPQNSATSAALNSIHNSNDKTSTTPASSKMLKHTST